MFWMFGIFWRFQGIPDMPKYTLYQEYPSRGGFLQQKQQVERVFRENNHRVIPYRVYFIGGGHPKNRPTDSNSGNDTRVECGVGIG